MRSLVVAAFTALLLSSCSDESRRALEAARAKNDPSNLPLEDGFNSYVRCTHLPDHTETGIIRFADGDTAKYWFRSHHLCDDIGGTIFQTSDGKTRYMRGYFCCEVQLPEAPLASRQDLIAFIDKHHGISP